MYGPRDGSGHCHEVGARRSATATAEVLAPCGRRQAPVVQICTSEFPAKTVAAPTKLLASGVVTALLQSLPLAPHPGLVLPSRKNPATSRSPESGSSSLRAAHQQAVMFCLTFTRGRLSAATYDASFLGVGFLSNSGQVFCFHKSARKTALQGPFMWQEMRWWHNEANAPGAVPTPQSCGPGDCVDFSLIWRIYLATRKGCPAD
jgi:hypothetical protein